MIASFSQDACMSEEHDNHHALAVYMETKPTGFRTYFSMDVGVFTSSLRQRQFEGRRGCARLQEKKNELIRKFFKQKLSAKMS